MTIEINGVTKDETAYDKWIQFTYEGVEYRVQLHWDKYEGFEMNFTDTTRSANWIETPDWVMVWAGENEDRLEYVLDSLTDQVIEKSY